MVGKTRVKLSVSLDQDLVKRIRAEAGQGRVSEWLNDAALLRLQGAMLDGLDAQFGPISARVSVEVRDEWPRS